jgi:hypothetical protein
MSVRRRRTFWNVTEMAFWKKAQEYTVKIPGVARGWGWRQCEETERKGEYWRFF